MKTNKRAEDRRVDRNPAHRLAGGYGTFAAVQDAEGLLRRAVMANLLWEDQFYMNGESVVDQIRNLVPQVDPGTVADIAIDARTKQRLRHVPLLLTREMARHASHKHLVSAVLPEIIRRPDELSEFLALYWKEGKCPISKQVKLGLAAAFQRFDEYQLAKWNRDSAIKLRDVMFLVHPTPKDNEQAALWKRLVDKELATPDTWEVALSAGADKKVAWERLIGENRLGVLAFIRNLANMEKVNVDPTIIRQGFEQVNPTWLLPINVLAAAKMAPRWERELETLMFRCLEDVVKLPGTSILVVDVSGSMRSSISAKSTMNRLEAAAALTMLAVEMCEHIQIYATAGSDHRRLHQTELLRPRRGFAVVDDVKNAYSRLGGGGIFTRQCLEYIRTQEREKPDRIIVFSDSQDCDRDQSRLPQPFGDNNYIVDVSAHTYGVNYKGVWDAEVAGWSEHFLTYISHLEQSVTSNQEA